MGTNEIEKTNQQLESHIGAKFWKGNLKRFAANGDQEGLFLLPNYDIKNTWFPTEVIIKPNPLTAVIENESIIYNFQFIDGNVIAAVKFNLNKLKID